MHLNMLKSITLRLKPNLKQLQCLVWCYKKMNCRTQWHISNTSATLNPVNIMHKTQENRETPPLLHSWCYFFYLYPISAFFKRNPSSVLARHHPELAPDAHTTAIYIVYSQCKMLYYQIQSIFSTQCVWGLNECVNLRACGEQRSQQRCRLSFTVATRWVKYLLLIYFSV